MTSPPHAPPGTVRLLLVRHAECDMNLTLSTHVGGRATESPLTALGRAQAAALGARLAGGGVGSGIASLHASPAVRAVDTAAAVAAACGLPPDAVTLHDDLHEIDMGAWSGKARELCYTKSARAAIDADPAGFAPPGGESQAAVEARVSACVAGIMGGLAPGGGPGVAVAHGLAIKCFLRGVMHADAASFAARNIGLANTGIVEVAHDGRASERERWHVLRVNDAAHLESLAL